MLLQAEASFPRPVAGLLRPAVRPPTQRYNMKLRAGKGFTLQELKVRRLGQRRARGMGERERGRCCAAWPA